MVRRDVTSKMSSGMFDLYHPTRVKTNPCDVTQPWKISAITPSAHQPSLSSISLDPIENRKLNEKTKTQPLSLSKNIENKSKKIREKKNGDGSEMERVRVTKAAVGGEPRSWDRSLECGLEDEWDRGQFNTLLVGC